MPTHDIVDNRDQRLVDHINRILGSTESARFATPSFALSVSKGLFIDTLTPFEGEGQGEGLVGADSIFGKVRGWDVVVALKSRVGP